MIPLAFLDFKMKIRYGIYIVLLIFSCKVFLGYVSDDKSYENDIALIRLSKPLDLGFDDSTAICLPTADEEIDPDTCTVAGWGHQGKISIHLLC